MQGRKCFPLRRWHTLCTADEIGAYRLQPTPIHTESNLLRTSAMSHAVGKAWQPEAEAESYDKTYPHVVSCTGTVFSTALL